jgi:hypothetical protein
MLEQPIRLFGKSHACVVPNLLPLASGAVGRRRGKFLAYVHS